MGRWQIKYVVVWGHMVEKTIHDLKLFMLQKFFEKKIHTVSIIRILAPSLEMSAI